MIRHDPTATLRKRLPRYLLLFNDLLLATKESSKKYTVKETLILADATLTDLSHDQLFPPFSFGLKPREAAKVLAQRGAGCIFFFSSRVAVPVADNGVYG